MCEKLDKAYSMENKVRIVRVEFQRLKTRCEGEKKSLSKRLVRTIEEFHDLGALQEYVRLIKNQLTLIDIRLKAHRDPEKQPLMETKRELERKIFVVQQAMRDYGSNQ